jgi:hypothetical protein
MPSAARHFNYLVYGGAPAYRGVRCSRDSAVARALGGRCLAPVRRQII